MKLNEDYFGKRPDLSARVCILGILYDFEKMGNNTENWKMFWGVTSRRGGLQCYG